MAKAKKKEKNKAVIDYDTIKGYKVHDVKTGSGKRRAVDNNDKIAAALRGLTEKDWSKIAKDNDVEVKNFTKLNAGLRRLALGNALRRILRTNGKITILGKIVKV